METSNDKEELEAPTAEQMLILDTQDFDYCLLKFHDVNNDGKEVGTLDFNEEGLLYFEGKSEESAQIFFDCLCKMMNDGQYKFKHLPTQMRHNHLHRALDELLACYITESGKLLGDTGLMEFLEWSANMTLDATCEEKAHDKE